MIAGETLRLMRNLRKLKQKTMADKLGISQPAYSKMENCKCIKGKRLEKVLQAFNCTITELETFESLLT